MDENLIVETKRNSNSFSSNNDSDDQDELVSSVPRPTVTGGKKGNKIAQKVWHKTIGPGVKGFHSLFKHTSSPTKNDEDQQVQQVSVITGDEDLEEHLHLNREEKKPDDVDSDYGIDEGSDDDDEEEEEEDDDDDDQSIQNDGDESRTGEQPNRVPTATKSSKKLMLEGNIEDAHILQFFGLIVALIFIILGTFMPSYFFSIVMFSLSMALFVYVMVKLPRFCGQLASYLITKYALFEYPLKIGTLSLSPSVYEKRLRVHVVAEDVGFANPPGFPHKWFVYCGRLEFVMTIPLSKLPRLLLLKREPLPLRKVPDFNCIAVVDVPFIDFDVVSVNFELYDGKFNITELTREIAEREVLAVMKKQVAKTMKSDHGWLDMIDLGDLKAKVCGKVPILDQLFGNPTMEKEETMGEDDSVADESVSKCGVDEQPSPISRLGSRRRSFSFGDSPILNIPRVNIPSSSTLLGEQQQEAEIGSVSSLSSSQLDQGKPPIIAKGRKEISFLKKTKTKTLEKLSQFCEPLSPNKHRKKAEQSINHNTSKSPPTLQPISSNLSVDSVDGCSDSNLKNDLKSPQSPQSTTDPTSPKIKRAKSKATWGKTLNGLGRSFKWNNGSSPRSLMQQSEIETAKKTLTGNNRKEKSIFKSYGEVLKKAQSMLPNKLEVTIVRARNLPATDRNLFTGKRSADPKVVVKVREHHRVTGTRYKTTMPMWQETFVLPVTDPSAVLHVGVWDEDLSTNELLGQWIITLKYLIIDPKYCWYDPESFQHQSDCPGHSMIKGWFPLANAKWEGRGDLGEIELIIKWSYDPLLKYTPPVKTALNCMDQNSRENNLRLGSKSKVRDMLNRVPFLFRIHRVTIRQVNVFLQDLFRGNVGHAERLLKLGKSSDEANKIKIASLEWKSAFKPRKGDPGITIYQFLYAFFITGLIPKVFSKDVFGTALNQTMAGFAINMVSSIQGVLRGDIDFKRIGKFGKAVGEELRFYGRHMKKKLTDASAETRCTAEDEDYLETAKLEGYFQKCSFATVPISLGRTWKRYYFMLKSQNLYYKSSEKGEPRKIPLKTIQLVTLDLEKKAIFIHRNSLKVTVLRLPDPVLYPPSQTTLSVVSTPEKDGALSKHATPSPPKSPLRRTWNLIKQNPFAHQSTSPTNSKLEQEDENTGSEGLAEIHQEPKLDNLVPSTLDDTVDTLEAMIAAEEVNMKLTEWFEGLKGFGVNSHLKASKSFLLRQRKHSTTSEDSGASMGFDDHEEVEFIQDSS